MAREKPCRRLPAVQRIAAGTVIKPIEARAVGKVVNDDRADWREAWALSLKDAGVPSFLIE